MKRALVTGSAGFIGRHVTAELIQRGFDVTQVDIRHDHPNDWDARDFFRADDSVRQYDVVVHAAAFVGGRTGIESRRSYLGAYNLQLDGALFEWALRAKPAHLVYLSSSAVYPVRLQTPVSEHVLLHEDLVDLDEPELPDLTYGWVKLTGEQLAAAYAHEQDLPVHVLRPFSGYGADQLAQYPFGAFLNRARAREDPFKVWGDGSQVRDWVHVDDVVGAIFAVTDAVIGYGAVNVCTGVGTSFNELARLFTSAVGGDYEPEIVHWLEGPRGVDWRVGDPTRLSELGYTAKIDLVDAIGRAVRDG